MLCRKNFLHLARNYIFFFPKISLAMVDKYCRIRASQGERIMLNDFEDVNRILAGMVDDGMVEPIDEPDCDPFDYAEVTGLWEEMYPEPEEMVDENGQVWYVN
jgi:hypothetical protein